MQRKMCQTWPFNPTSPHFKIRNEWGKEMDRQMKAENMPLDGSIAHGCHEIQDEGLANEGPAIDPNIQCVGHLDWIKGVKHA
jgi:hypothetical protein